MISSLYRALITGLVILFMGIGATAQGSKEMSENEIVIREFVAAWSRLDAGELASYFTEEGIYHNIPSGPVQGRGNIERFIAGFISPWQGTEWEIITLLANDDTVVVERMDKTIVAGKEVNLPCLGVFEMEAGKIKIWRDYFDLATYTDALTTALGSQ